MKVPQFIPPAPFPQYSVRAKAAEGHPTTKTFGSFFPSPSSSFVQTLIAALKRHTPLSHLSGGLACFAGCGTRFVGRSREIFAVKLLFFFVVVSSAFPLFSLL